MVPLRSETYSESYRPSNALSRPRLRLVTFEDDGQISQSQTKPQTRRRGRAAGRGSSDRVWFVAVMAVMAIFAVASTAGMVRNRIGDSLQRSAYRPYVVGVVVKPGESLWKYAERYGAPSRYILDRIDAIARDNGISAAQTLVPGQHLRIRVENPTLLASLQRAHTVRLAGG